MPFHNGLLTCVMCSFHRMLTVRLAIKKNSLLQAKSCNSFPLTYSGVIVFSDSVSAGVTIGKNNIPLTSRWTMASAVPVSPFPIYDLNIAWTGTADMLILARLDISDGADAFQTSGSRSKYGIMISSVVLSVFLFFFFFLKPVSTDLLTSGSLCWWGNECLIRWMERTDVLLGFRMSLYPYRCLLAIIIVIAIDTVSLSFMLDCLGLQLWLIPIPFF